MAETDFLIIDKLWVLIAAAMVFFMQCGFMFLEVGNVREKSIASVAIKNAVDWVIVSIAFYLVGFGLMFGSSQAGVIGFSDFAPTGVGEGRSPLGLAFLIFQTAFATTAATIISGALAERIRFGNYLIISLIVGTLVYPIFGHWAWGGGWIAENKPWLAALGFIDFAGSSVVHMVGGTIALIGLFMVGPRLDRFDADGNLREFKTYSIPFGVAGTFILAFGWWGFNGGSTLAFNETVPYIILTTCLSGAAGGLVALSHSMLLQKGDFACEKFLGGVLGGLVAITACCHIVHPLAALGVGATSGLIHNFAFDIGLKKFKLDDPVGAVPVHFACGIWGILCVAIFGKAEAFGENSRLLQLGIQVFGVLACLAWAGIMGFLTFKVLEKWVGLRVSPSEEFGGLTIGARPNTAQDPVFAAQMAELRDFLKSMPAEAESHAKDAA